MTTLIITIFIIACVGLIIWATWLTVRKIARNKKKWEKDLNDLARQMLWDTTLPDDVRIDFYKLLKDRKTRNK